MKPMMDTFVTTIQIRILEAQDVLGVATQIVVDFIIKIIYRVFVQSNSL